MRINSYFFCFIISFLLISDTAYSQNFDETWKEFLENNKISNMSRLSKPDKRYEEADYARYLLMNTNNNFCQSKIENAEGMMAELQEMDSDVQESIPGFTKKMKDLEIKMKAYHEIDAVWNRFLKTRDVTVDELEEIFPPSTICEKQTLVKYSYMTAHYYLCSGDIEKSKNTFENRTLKIAEKTSLRVKDVKGLAPEVAKMKSLYINMPKLDEAWNTYVETGVSPGFDIELPVFPCYPVPKMKEFVLKGVFDVCKSGSAMLKKIKTLQAESGIVPDEELDEKIKELEDALNEKEVELSSLNKAWEAFVPENKVNNFGEYGYEYCSKEPLIRAYIMDGFVFVCETAEEMLEKIDSLQRSRPAKLDKTTKAKIKELKALKEQYQFNGMQIDRIWDEFVSEGDTLIEDFDSTDKYCDHIQEVKDWTMKGLSAPSCQEGLQYLAQIEASNENFEFKYYEELECRVQKLRVKIWDCRYQALLDLAQLETSPDSYQERLNELMEEYGIEDRPEDCLPDE